MLPIFTNSNSLACSFKQFLIPHLLYAYILWNKSPLRHITEFEKIKIKMEREREREREAIKQKEFNLHIQE